MTMDLLAMPWLPAPGEDWRSRAKQVDTSNKPGAAARELAGHALDAAHSRLLSRRIARAMQSGRPLDPLTRLRLAVLSSATFDFIADALPAAGARHGLAIDLHIAPADTIEACAFDPGSDTYAHCPDAVLVLVDHRWLGLASPRLGLSPAAGVDAAVARLRGVIGALQRGQINLIVVPTVAIPPLGLFGSFDACQAGSVRAQILAFNARMVELARDVGAVVLDVAALSEQVGTARWFHAPSYNLYKLPFLPAAVPLFADWVARLLSAAQGKARKCLVLDLDNTCWGGVIGDDGIEGIRIGPGSAEGESFAAVQQAALDLKARGVILAVSSKNDDATARAPFRDHPDMLLRETDIAVFQANWDDKPANLRAIADALAIGLDALVLLDDNAAERAQVRSMLPMVAVPELPNDAAYYPTLLLAAGYFEAVGFSDEDSLRSASYHANAQRVAIGAATGDTGEFLAALGMIIGHARFDPIGRPRIAQLVNKSNQFNLTTRRYSEGAIAAIEAEPATYTQQTRLSDQFGNFGVIGVIIARLDTAGDWMIDTWLMSCRVLGRRVENAMLAELVRQARARGIARIHAQYLPTAKNGMVRDHYDKLGFARTAQDQDGAQSYVLNVIEYNVSDLPFHHQPGADVQA
ncbi:HAD-IIIC family phosphatase [Novosphingobium acidiphilum]|uniref:HAD-IIIC family phosphatase n=1 Tax=Novosphingobium acidiphilum TaxID=505248 RepID=UPI0009FFD2DB|nr:HAD-IIIC family phosphatase [Novosphingobium acidiphilum]